MEPVFPTASERSRRIEGISVEGDRLFVDALIECHLLGRVHVLADERTAKHVLHRWLQLRLEADQRQRSLHVLFTDLSKYPIIFKSPACPKL